MKRLFYIAATVALSVSCTGQSYTITGAIPEAGDSVFLLSSEDKSVIAAAPAGENGEFTIKGALEKPDFAILANGDQQPLTLIFLESGEVRVEAGENEPFLSICGTPSNDALTNFNRVMMDLQNQFFAAATPEEQTALYKRADSLSIAAIKNNHNLYGIYMLSSNSHRMDDAEILEFFKALPAELQDNSIVTEVKTLIECKANTEVGSSYTDISFPDTEGNIVKLSDYIDQGKWVLLDFWATWCSPCKAQIPYILEAYNEYKDKGLVVVAVSLDNSTEDWKAYIAEHGLNWVNLYGRENKEAQKEVMKYAVQTIPSNFLISPDGIIVAKGLHNEGVKQTLEEHIK